MYLKKKLKWIFKSQQEVENCTSEVPYMYYFEVVTDKVYVLIDCVLVRDDL